MNEENAANTKSNICVIVPVFNAEKTVRRCLLSIFRQSYRDILIVVVDDGSTDRSAKIIAEMAKKDRRLIPIHQRNAGSISARKAGIRYALDHGIPFFCFCDADDRLPSHAIEKMANAILRTDSDLVCGNMKKRWKAIVIPNTFKPDCLKIGAPVLYSKEEIKEKLIISYFGVSNFPVSFWAKMYKTSCIAKFIDDDPVVWFYGEDLSVTLKIMLSVDNLCIIPETVYYYQTGGASGGLMPTMLEDFISLYRFRQEIIEKHSLGKKCSVYMAIEAMNVMKTYLSKCLEFKAELNKDRSRFVAVVAETISLPVFQEASATVLDSGVNNKMAVLVQKRAVDEIAALIDDNNKADRKSIKGKIRRIINKIG